MFKAIWQCLRRRQYLLRLLSSCIGLLVLPSFLSIILLTNQAYQQMIHTNQDFLTERSISVNQRFQNELTKIFKNAATIEVDSWDYSKPLSVLNLSTLRLNPYYYYEGIEALKAHNVENQYDVYIFFPQIDCILGTSGKYTENEFMEHVFPGCSEEIRQEAEAFFYQTQSTDLRMLSSFSIENEKGSLLLGIPVRLGVNRSDGLIIYRLQAHSLNDALFSSPEEKKLQIIYLNQKNEKPIYSTGSAYFNLETVVPFSPNQEIQDFSVAGDHYLSIEFPVQLLRDIKFVSLIPFDLISSGLHAFYSAMRAIMNITFVILTVLMAALIYLNYKPVHQLASQTACEESNNELESISKALDRMAGQISEQDMIIMDMLLANMLHGIPIREEEARRLGLPGTCKFYCVLTAQSHELNTDERERLTDIARKKYSILLYITELFYTNQNIFICLTDHESIDSFAAYLQEELNRQNDHGPILLQQGKIVSSINDICRSYASCQSTDESSAAEEKNSAKQLSEKILLYLKDHFADAELTQSTVADTFGISIYSLSRLFKNQVGIGFSEYVTGKRLEFSQRQLLLTNDSISDIARASGFLNANYFSRLFKSHFGVSPLCYRQTQKRSEWDDEKSTI